MADDLVDICGRIVKSGLKLGADEIEVFTVSQRSIEAGYENNEMKMAKSNATSAAGIRVFKGKSLGFSSVNSLEQVRLDKALAEAIALSKKAPPDEYNGLPKGKPMKKLSGLYDERIRELGVEEIVDKANRMLAAAESVDSRVSVDGGRFEATVGKKAIVNSQGVEGSEDFSAIYYDIGAHAVEGGDVASLDYRFDGSRMLSKDNSEEISVELAKAAIESLSAKKMGTQMGTVILSPLASIEILVSPILFSVDSSNVQKGVSRFKDKMGEKVSAGILTIMDDGTLPEGLSSSAFDREGVPHAPLGIVVGGKLEAFLHDSYTARKEGVESNGHAAGGPRGVPTIDATNISVKPGTMQLQDMIASVKSGLLVQRFSGRVDPVSGDFSGVAKGSKNIEGGSERGVVKETLISGNVFDVLTRLSGLSSETKKVLDFELPYFMVEDVSITGG
jgi:PmbA protein